METSTCQRLVNVGNFKLNLLSTQINIYCLMTNQTPALLVQRAPWDVITVPLIPTPPPAPNYIPDARPLGIFENQDSRDGKTQYI